MSAMSHEFELHWWESRIKNKLATSNFYLIFGYKFCTSPSSRSQHISPQLHSSLLPSSSIKASSLTTILILWDIAIVVPRIIVFFVIRGEVIILIFIRVIVVGLKVGVGIGVVGIAVAREWRAVVARRVVGGVWIG
jgi:hypothetical protein